MRTTIRFAIGLSLALACLRALAPAPALGQAEASESIDRHFRESVRPFLDTYCLGCHGGESRRAIST